MFVTFLCVSEEEQKIFLVSILLYKIKDSIDHLSRGFQVRFSGFK